MTAIDLPSGGGPGIILIECGLWTKAVCTTIRRLGCEWPIQVWHRTSDTITSIDDDDTYHVDADQTAVDFGETATDAYDAAVKFTHFDRVVVIPCHVYPHMPPCRLDKRMAGISTCWNNDVEPRLRLIDRSACSRQVNERPPKALPSGLVYHVAGRLSFVRVTSIEPGNDLPGWDAFRSLLESLR